jgi:hypothetical protein
MSPESLIHALDAAVRDDFQSLRNSYFALLKIATVAVAIGVAFEGAEEFNESKEELTRLWRHFRPKPVAINPSSELPVVKREPVLKWQLLLASVGWVLIVGGVAGEFFFESMASDADALIQTFNTTLLIAAQDQARDASDRASTAFNQARDASREAGEAQERAAANELAAALLRREAAEIEAEVAWRKLTRKQEVQIGTALKQFSVTVKPFTPESAQVTARLLYTKGNPEEFSFASDIGEALKLAFPSWTVFPPVDIEPTRMYVSPLPLLPSITGVTVASAPDQPTLERARFLAKELSARGFDTKISLLSGSEPFGHVVITTGFRPPGPQGEAKILEQRMKAKNHR